MDRLSKNLDPSQNGCDWKILYRVRVSSIVGHAQNRHRLAGALQSLFYRNANCGAFEQEDMEGGEVVTTVPSIFLVFALFVIGVLIVIVLDR